LKFDIIYKMGEDVTLSEIITIVEGQNALERAYNEAFRRCNEIEKFLGLEWNPGRKVRVTYVKQASL